MKTRTKTEVQYEDCHECPYFEIPDANGKIKAPGGLTIKINKSVLKKGKLVPNPIIGRCGVDGKRLNHHNGCDRWFVK